jgi:hypothetical protein
MRMTMTDQKYLRDFEERGFEPGDPVPLSFGHKSRRWSKEYETKAEMLAEHRCLRDAVVEAVADWYVLRGTKHTSRLRVAYQALVAFERLHGLR